MSDFRDEVPGYRAIRVGALGSAAQAADDQAWLARKSYPSLIFADGPVFGTAHELEHGGWELDYLYCLSPQEAREAMASDFRELAQQQAGGGAEHAECMRAAEQLGREALDELTVLGTRYRVIRAEQFIRSGPQGPEPPRSSDPDPGEPGMSHLSADPAEGFVIDPATPTGMSEGILKAELLGAGRPADSDPGQARDLAHAALTHPGGVLLPAGFTIGTVKGGTWGSASPHVWTTQQAARDELVSCLRISLPAQLGLPDDKRAVYSAAADLAERDRANEVTVAEHQFRVVRVERLVRIGPEGPEGPRPSDPGPEPPVMQLPPVPEGDDQRPSSSN
jgi:Family of unknown function (DUF5954)